MLLILSGAFVQDDLRSEFGLIPPTFLPVGNHPLLEWQLERAARDLPQEHIVVSIPESFILTVAQKKLIRKFDANIVRVPRGLDLSQSLLFVLNVVGIPPATLYLLHGDTLLEKMSATPDSIGIGQTQDDYGWHAIDTEATDIDSVWCGYFTFSKPQMLVRELAIHRSSFVDAVNAYSDKIPVKLLAVEGWLDCGHLNTYFAARKKFTTQRAFNSLAIQNGIVAKSGMPKEKIKAEARWFELLPAQMKRFTPAYYGYNEEKGEYAIEYLPMSPLNEMFVHGRNPVSSQSLIFSMIAEWIDEAYHVEIPFDNQLKSEREFLIKDKTRERLVDFGLTNEISLEASVVFNGAPLPSIRDIAEEMIARSMQTPPIPGLLHGDLCFSNCVFDARNKRIRIFDPRGIPVGSGLSKRDLYYDIAKFGHSAVGLYDLIIAGAFEATFDKDSLEFTLGLDASDEQLAFGDAFLSWKIPNTTQTGASALPQIILLFLSMLPLHSDDRERQLALLANALRLYANHYLER